MKIINDNNNDRLLIDFILADYQVVILQAWLRLPFCPTVGSNTFEQGT